MERAVDRSKRQRSLELSHSRCMGRYIYGFKCRSDMLGIWLQEGYSGHRWKIGLEMRIDWSEGNKAVTSVVPVRHGGDLDKDNGSSERGPLSWYPIALKHFSMAFVVVYLFHRWLQLYVPCFMFFWFFCSVALSPPSLRGRAHSLQLNLGWS